MEPFDRYPYGGRKLLGPPRTGDGTCRRGYGLSLMRKTGQTTCAHRGMNLVDDYRHWLLTAVDHVVPMSTLRQLDIPTEFGGDCINMVLACAGCNGFRNRYAVDLVLAPKRSAPDVWTLEDFLTLRDAVFAQRFEIIATRRQVEMAFFEERHWLERPQLNQ